MEQLTDSAKVFVHRDFHNDRMLLEAIGGYEVNEAGNISNPGKMESESLVTPYFWALAPLTPYPSEEISADYTQITTDDVLKFPKLLAGQSGFFYCMSEDSQGFVTGWIEDEEPKPYEETEKQKAILAQNAEAGFDESYPTEDGGVRVKCSQCEAAVINGTPCHETGCRNAIRSQYDEDSEDEDR